MAGIGTRDRIHLVLLAFSCVFLSSAVATAALSAPLDVVWAMGLHCLGMTAAGLNEPLSANLLCVLAVAEIASLLSEGHRVLTLGIGAAQAKLKAVISLGPGVPLHHPGSGLDNTAARLLEDRAAPWPAMPACV